MKQDKSVTDNELKLKYNSWLTLPIGVYEKIKGIIRDGGENYEVELLSLLCGVDSDVIMNLPIRIFSRLIKDAGFIMTKPDVKSRLKFKSIVIDGVKYNIFTDFKDITTAQYIDFQTFYSDFEKYYCNILACFIIPEGHNYNDGYDAMETAELFRDKLSVEVAENACFFFASRSKDSLLNGLRRLVWRVTLMEVRTKNPEMKENLTKTRLELMKEIDVITSLGKLMMSHISNG